MDMHKSVSGEEGRKERKTEARVLVRFHILGEPTIISSNHHEAAGQLPITTHKPRLFGDLSWCHMGTVCLCRRFAWWFARS